MKPIVFSHYSNFGDIIYSIPFQKAVLNTRNQKTCKFVIVINYPMYIDPNINQGQHPCGNVTVTDTVAKMLKPLLLNTKLYDSVEIHDYRDGVYMPDSTYDHLCLEGFRALGMNLASGSITKWYSNLYPCTTNIDDTVDWLGGTKLIDKYKNKIIVCRSSRYWLPMNYSLLEKYGKDIIVLGTPLEHEALESIIGRKLEYKQINNFLEAYRIISSCKLFIGNQTGLTSMAISSGVPLLLECCKKCPNVIPNKKNQFQVFNNRYFKEMLSIMLE